MARAGLPGLLAAALCASLAAAAVGERLTVGAFSSARPGGALPEGWQPLGLQNVRSRTQYALVDDNGTTVLRADSSAGASGLSRKLHVDPAEYPILRWRWKISNTLKDGDVYRREGDDYPARIYVMFDYPIEKLPFAERMKLRLARALHDPDLPAATLCYVWDSKAAAGTMTPSTYTDRVHMIVVESGSARVGRWVDLERDIHQDFRLAFGEEPPAISAVALATDTDNTGAAVTAWYGDISLHKRAVSGGTSRPQPAQSQ